MAVKRLTIEIPWEQYEILRREATLRRSTVSGIIRELIDGLRRPRRNRKRQGFRGDPFFKMKGSFEGLRIWPRSTMTTSMENGVESHPLRGYQCVRGLKNARDARHQEAMTSKERSLRAGRPMVTSDYVLDESYTMIRRRSGHRVAVEFGEDIRASQVVRVEFLMRDVIEQAWALFKRLQTRTSVSRCASFVLMRRLGLHEAFAFDGHFTQAGFRELRM